MIKLDHIEYMSEVKILGIIGKTGISINNMSIKYYTVNDTLIYIVLIKEGSCSLIKFYSSPISDYDDNWTILDWCETYEELREKYSDILD